MLGTESAFGYSGIKIKTATPFIVIVQKVFFIYIGKEKSYMEKRRHQKQCPQSIQEVYSKSLKAQPKGGGKEAKNITCLYLEPNQSMKLTREIGLIFTDTLDQDHRLHTKEIFNLWIDNSSLSNTNMTIYRKYIVIVQNVFKTFLIHQKHTHHLKCKLKEFYGLCSFERRTYSKTSQYLFL